MGRDCSGDTPAEERPGRFVEKREMKLSAGAQKRGPVNHDRRRVREGNESSKMRRSVPKEGALGGALLALTGCEGDALVERSH